MQRPFHEILFTPLVVIGGAPVTLAGLIIALAIAVLSFLAARIAVGLIGRVRSRMNDGGVALYILEKFTGYGIVIIGLLFALSSIGLNLSSLAVFAGAVGVGVGLGLQGVVKEFVSGLVLLFDSILNVGDYVELPGAGGLRGVVHEIGARATHIRTNDNLDIFVPNSRLIEERFINWTLQGQTRRIHIPFSVAYGSDKAHVRDVVLAAARGIEATLSGEATRQTQVRLIGFGDSSLNFELVVWPTLAAVKRPAAMHAAYTWAIDDALRAAGIEIPFPQRDVRLRSVLGREGDAGFEALGLTPGIASGLAPARRRPEAAESRNDAAQDLAHADEDGLEPPVKPPAKPPG
ncbi:MAG TPA: mechanosensitive ion channel domain-containing protein [Rhizomicrobium sp.]|nr:mechanosensitive ion channel domain-containing protein [Rhizomicrobium sp.]